MVNTPAAAQLEALRGYYQLHFAHRPRASRSLAMLEKLREQVHLLAHDPVPAVQAEAQDLARTWAAEAAAIAHAQQDGESGGWWSATEAAEEAQRLLWRTARVQVLHPAPLAARPHQLQVLAAELLAGRDQVTKALAGAQEPARAVLRRAEQNLAHALGHVEALRAGALAARHAAELPLRLQAAVSAARAALCDLAEAVAGRTPVVVRPSFLEGLVVDLQEALTVLEAAAEAGFGGDEHRQNCVALAEQATSWQVQLRQVVAKRRQYTADEVAGALGEEADAVMDAAEALREGPSDRQAKAYLALRMDEIHRQLAGVPLLFGHAQHRETLAGLADCLAWLESARVEGATT